MERKIGEIFEYNGEWYQCIPDTTDDNCNNCFFQKSCSSITGDCSSTARSDGKSVAFKNLEKVGEPFTCTIYGDERLRMQEYKLYDVNFSKENALLMYISDYKHKRIAIEIKQNKEDMKEKKLNLKPFDLKAAKAGKPVCTRDGRKARIICFDMKLLFNGISYPIIALVEDTAKEETIYGYNEKGKVLIEDDATYKDDLMMLPQKKEGWINLFKNNHGDTLAAGVFPNREEAVSNCPPTYLSTIKIEWEE